MKVCAAMRLSVLLYLIQILLCHVSARYTNEILPNNIHFGASTRIQQETPGVGYNHAKERTLYQLLISALNNSDLDSYAIEATKGAEGEKRDNYKQAKPCYWSLVSCYKKRGYVYVGKRK